jgi:geranylgeranyl reductase family protein
MDFDLLVIGAGPAGSAAARRAAQAGLSVALVDRFTFPRDKSCGDALMPDALSALDTLGLAPALLPLTRRTHRVRIYAPNGRCVALAGEAACVPRRVFDQALQAGAVEAGARFFAPFAVVGPLITGGTVVGARFLDLEHSTLFDLRARMTVLATGANAEPLKGFGVCLRCDPSALAARVYVRIDPVLDAIDRDIVISYDASICPGYGWIFPGPDSVFNVGVGFFHDARRRPRPPNLRLLLRRFLETFPVARALMRHAVSVSRLRGAPLRTAMTGADFSRPGLLVAGEAAGLTYSASGEGIGKAMQSGILAADIVAAHTPAAAVEQVASEYARQLTGRFAQRFRDYKRAQDWLTSPGFGNFLAWRATSGSFVKRQLEAMFVETSAPGALFSPLGLARALVS